MVDGLGPKLHTSYNMEPNKVWNFILPAANASRPGMHVKEFDSVRQRWVDVKVLEAAREKLNVLAAETLYDVLQLCLPQADATGEAGLTPGRDDDRRLISTL
eukprot:51558-Eustigmatos_ZCMA.PRE.1